MKSERILEELKLYLNNFVKKTSEEQSEYWKGWHDAVIGINAVLNLLEKEDENET